jgi:tRNA-2-methylthio-N6-dimethylallyladenosine synthase
VTTRVTSAAPHYLRADDAPLSARRTRAGDAWEARKHAAPEQVSAPAAAQAAPAPVLLGMPARRG